MEVTDERFNYMKNLLVMLYADQIGMNVIRQIWHVAKEMGNLEYLE